MLLLRPTKKGHGALYLRKFAVMTAAVLLGFLLICGVDLAIAVRLFGIDDLSRPISSFDRPNSQWAYDYHRYSAQLVGTPSAASDQLIAEERERFAELHKRIDSYSAAVGDAAAASPTASLQDELRPEKAFLDAAAQYEALQPGPTAPVMSACTARRGSDGADTAVFQEKRQ